MIRNGDIVQVLHICGVTDDLGSDGLYPGALDGHVVFGRVMSFDGQEGPDKEVYSVTILNSPVGALNKRWGIYRRHIVTGEDLPDEIIPAYAEFILLNS